MILLSRGPLTRMALDKGIDRCQHLMCESERGRSLFTRYGWMGSRPDSVKERFQLKLQRLAFVSLELFDGKSGVRDLFA